MRSHLIYHVHSKSSIREISSKWSLLQVDQIEKLQRFLELPRKEKTCWFLHWRLQGSHQQNVSFQPRRKANNGRNIPTSLGQRPCSFYRSFTIWVQWEKKKGGWISWKTKNLKREKERGQKQCFIQYWWLPQKWIRWEFGEIHVKLWEYWRKIIWSSSC